MRPLLTSQPLALPGSKQLVDDLEALPVPRVLSNPQSGGLRP